MVRIVPVMQKPTTFPELLANWTTLDLSEDLGVPYVNARKMRERGSVSVDYWPSLIEKASAKGIDLEYSDLVAMKRAAKAGEAAA